MWKIKNLIWIIVTLIGASFFSTVSAQQVYKSVDAQGNIVYSDQPSLGAQSVSPPSISIVPASTPATVPTTIQPAPTMTVYTQLALISPVNDQTIRDNNGNVNVTIALSPTLGSKDMIQVILDGKIAASSNSSSNFSLTNIDRGTHVLQAQIINNQEKIVKVSNVVTFYLHKANKTTTTTGLTQNASD